MLLEDGVCSDQGHLLEKFCQHLPCFILYSETKFSCYSRYLLISSFCIPVPNDEKDIFIWCQFQKVLQIFTELFNFNFFSISGQGLDFNYCDIEWFALEVNRDHAIERLLLNDKMRDSWPPEEMNSIWGQRRGWIAQSFCVIKFY